MVMTLSKKLVTAIFTLVVGVASMARAHKAARPFSSSLDQRQHHLPTRRSLRRVQDIFSHNDSGKGKGRTKKSKGSKGSKGSKSSTSSSSDQSPPTSAPTSLLSCPCFNSTNIDIQVEVLENSECVANAPDLVLLLGDRPNGTYWEVAAGLAEGDEEFPACSFLDPANGFDIVGPTFISSDELEDCQSILLGSQMFATNNCTVA